MGWYTCCLTQRRCFGFCREHGIVTTRDQISLQSNVQREFWKYKWTYIYITKKCLYDKWKKQVTELCETSGSASTSPSKTSFLSLTQVRRRSDLCISGGVLAGRPQHSSCSWILSTKWLLVAHPPRQHTHGGWQAGSHAGSPLFYHPPVAPKTFSPCTSHINNHISISQIIS